MPIHIVRLGTPRQPGEGLRLGTVRRPPRGVPKSEFSKRDYYDTWLPNLSPRPELVAEALAVVGDEASGKASEKEGDKAWAGFRRKFVAQMKEPDASHLLDMLAALSHQTSLSMGCYCENEARCHRSILRELLVERGADVR